MTKKSKQSNGYKRGDKFGDWTLEEYLGGGGNGDVWLARNPKHAPHAIKLLKTVTTESYTRFTAEIDALSKLGTLNGIVPLIEKHTPKEKGESTPWYAMPVAQPFKEYRIGRSAEEIARDFIALASTLGQLHSKGISHRDIKPANFLYYNDQLCLSDFGLVKYPNRQPITPPKRDVGAKFTMAPEMRRHASEANGEMADVYSFAKSLWIAFTKEDLGFDGQYNPDSSLSLNKYLKGVYTTTLDQLLVECTDTDPLRRPRISHVAKRIEEWLNIVSDFHKRNLIEWTELQQKLFPLGAPSQSTWTQIDAICSVLSEVAKVRALNHMFYPTGGGNTITGVSRAFEEEMIELHVGEMTAEILKPKKLTYESFGTAASWNYFRLEVAPIEPTGIKGALDQEGVREELTELKPGTYIPYHHWNCNEYSDEPLPATARPISRYIKGCFVFFSTRSAYNADPRTYDARHNKMTEDEFRDYIRKNASRRDSSE
ncbi:protein kinase domain-containing protein [Hydrogenophaga sp. SL48]|uniref:protein kinase domain-containing protein n=1 Tax=Hydrogenophaga sp. SL48 TaxID=2806347 RepID=UPI001EFF6E14|nr:protein kinase [Hydrogenophaga sp. SL48]UJW80102.1 protein kinase [Hydrogenophaga sp. SL48]